jgi:phosphoglycerate dehydrogenase-like enzyme
MKVAVLDDYQGVALTFADWSAIRGRATVDIFNDHLSDSHALVQRLRPYDVVCVMRERTPLSRAIIARLPNLKLIASTGARNAAIDLNAATEHRVQVLYTRSTTSAAVELTWALILGVSRHILSENASLCAGGWQRRIGEDLADATLGVVGLGRIGTQVARIAGAFGMRVIAWSQNLSASKAAEAGVRLVSKEVLFQEADVVTVHLVLSDRTAGLIGTRELTSMKSSARLINTSRGAIVDESALIQALASGQIAGAAIDVYDIEPLPQNHPFRGLDGLLATPHIGYVSRRAYEQYYRDTVANIAAWIDGQKI